jgi:hypothetical protein
MLRVSIRIYLSLIRMYVTLVLRSTRFTPLWFDATCEYTPLLNLRPFCLSVTPFGWLTSFTLSSYVFRHLLREYNFLFIQDFLYIKPVCKARPFLYELINPRCLPHSQYIQKLNIIYLSPYKA